MLGLPPTGLKRRAMVRAYRDLTTRALPRSGFVHRPASAPTLRAHERLKWIDLIWSAFWIVGS